MSAPSEINGKQRDICPIAVIGMAGRFPGDAKNVNMLWDMLVQGRSALGAVPLERWNREAHWHPDGLTNLTDGHFINDNVEAFDAPFFNITTAEANCMDPQQRLLLENVFEAVENAGIVWNDIHSSNTSVFVGAFGDDYKTIQDRDPERSHKPTGLSNSILSNRVSWFFDLKGGSVTVDTACSSSMVALHLACQDLQCSSSNMAIVSGVNLMIDPTMMYRMSSSGFLSPDGRCYSFDHRANGYSRGEGVGTVIVKPLTDALRDGNTIRAVIRGTGINQDGRTPGITQPSRLAQESLISEVYATAGLDTRETRYIEAHGTGTPAGDPIEATAIVSAWGRSGPREDLYIGALKTNIGHLEGAAGIASIIKSISVIEHGVIPPNLNMEKVNPKVPAEKWNLKFPLQLTAWPCSGVRRASINGFGFGGTNCHIILEDARHYLQSHQLSGQHATSALKVQEEQQNDDEGKLHRLFVWSSCDGVGVKRNMDRFFEHLQKVSLFNQGGESNYLRNLAYTLCTKRTFFPWRDFVVADSLPSLLTTLSLKLKDPFPWRAREGVNLGFVFTGQGAQWHGMGCGLLSYPAFRDSLEAASKFFRLLGSSWNLIENFVTGEVNSLIDQPIFSQPMCTALQVALIDLLDTWHVRPTRVVGHSSGEIAAAYCSGAISRKAAWELAYHRGVVSSKLDQQIGAMMSVGLSEKEIERFLPLLDGKITYGEVVVACINSPKNITVSGDKEKVLLLKALLDKENVFARLLNVQIAYHSPHMNGVAADYMDSLGTSLNSPPDSHNDGSISMFSSLIGEKVPPEELRTTKYWVSNLVSPVKFAQALHAMCSSEDEVKALSLSNSSETPIQHLLEIGPHPALRSAVRETLSEANLSKAIRYSCLLARNSAAVPSALQAIGELVCHGYQADLEITCRAAPSKPQPGQECVPRMLVDLPCYSFNHASKNIYESRVSKAYRFRKSPELELLGTEVAGCQPHEPKWRNWIGVEKIPWVQDHKVSGQILYPGVAYLVMAVEACRQIQSSAPASGYRLRDIFITRALQIPENDNVETILSMRQSTESSKGDSSTWKDFNISSYNPIDESWTEHCRGMISVEYEKSPELVNDGKDATSTENSTLRLNGAIENCTQALDVSKFYQDLEAIGISFGPLFQNLVRLEKGNRTGEGLATIRVPPIESKTRVGSKYHHLIHPTTLDSMLHVLFASIQDARGTDRLPEPLVPVQIKQLWLSGEIETLPGRQFRCHSISRQTSHTNFEVAVTAWDASTHDCVVEIEGLRVTPLQTSVQEEVEPPISYGISWERDVDLLDQTQAPALLRHEAAAVHQNDSQLCQEGSDLAIAAAIYVLDAVKQLETQILDETYPHHVKYLQWLRDRAFEFSSDTISSQNIKVASLMTSSDAKEEFLTSVRKSNSSGELVGRMGSSIVPILRRESDVIETMFQDNLLERFYRENPAARNIHQLLHSYLKLVSHKYANIKILEIGAGTGGTTLSVLQALTSSAPTDGIWNCKIASYTYTDVSAGFFDSAKVKFAAWKNIMDFRVLDVETDPARQGFEENTYDIVLASNVLHATTNLDVTLRNVHRLLRPKGRLILHEITKPSIWEPMCFGLLPGWWLGTEVYRHSSPLISDEKWEQLLRNTGFSGIDLLLHDDLNVDVESQSLIVSTTPTDVSIPKNQTVFIVHQTSELQSRLISVLIRELESLGILNYRVVMFSELMEHSLAGAVCIVLPELEASIFGDIDEDAFSGVQRLLTTSAGVLWVTKDFRSSPEMAIVVGVIRTVRWERTMDGSNLVTLSIEEPQSSHDRVAKQIAKIFKAQFYDRTAMVHEEYLIANDAIYINRLVPAHAMDHALSSDRAKMEPKSSLLGQDETRTLMLHTDTPGLLSHLHFIDWPGMETPLLRDQIEVHIAATGLNFRDIMVAMGELQSRTFGHEGAGTIKRVGEGVKKYTVGDRVLVLSAQPGCFATYARCHQDVAVKIPDNMTFEVAAGIPLIFSTAYYCLYNVARLSKEESVLIHAAAGGVGQVAIMLAQHIGAEVFATCSSMEKKTILMETYGVPADHIFSSRDLTFAQGIRRATRGRGVNVILNSLAGEALRTSWECIAPFGRFVEIGKRDIEANGRLEMLPFSKGATFAAVDLSLLVEHDMMTIQSLLKYMIDLWEDNVIRKTTPFTVFDYSQIEDAFRLLQSGKHIGKVVLKANKDDLIKIVQRPDPPYMFNPMMSYLLVGGLGGLGRSIARWMASRGARSLVFLSRSGETKDKEVQKLLDDLRGQSCRSTVLRCDVANGQQLNQALEKCQQTLPPIKGCIQAAMQLSDAVFEKMSCDVLHDALDPKFWGSKNLHEMLPRDVDFYIMLSSICGLIGNRGQANYAAGNTYQDALAHFRRSQGLPATSLNLGNVRSIGYLAENLDRLKINPSVFTVLDGVREDQLLRAIEQVINPKTVDRSFTAQVAVGLVPSGKFRQKGVAEPAFLGNPLFAHLQSPIGYAAAGTGEDSLLYVQSQLKSAKSLEESVRIITSSLITRLSSIISVPAGDINSARPIQHYGIDSLVAMELRNWIAKDMAADVPVLDIIGMSSIEVLSIRIASASKIVAETCPPKIASDVDN